MTCLQPQPFQAPCRPMSQLLLSVVLQAEVQGKLCSSAACNALVKGQTGLSSCLSGFAEYLQSCGRCRTCWHTDGSVCSTSDDWSALHVPCPHLQEELQKVRDQLAAVQQAGEQQREILKAEQDRHSQCQQQVQDLQLRLMTREEELAGSRAERKALQVQP